MSARLVHNLDDLTRDLERKPAEVARKGAGAVRDSAQQGNRIAKRLARQSSGRHARLYPGTFTAGRSEGSRNALSAQGGAYAWEYGPEARGQGLLAPILERGSRNNPPHLDLAQSADIVGAYGTYGARIERMLGRLFW